jgi:hypothetical protein
MNPHEEQLTSHDIVLLRSLLGRFGGQVTPAASTPAPPIASESSPMLPIPPIPNNGIQQRYPSATQPASAATGSLSQSMLPSPVPVQNAMVLPQVPQHSAPHPGLSGLNHPSVAPTILPYHSALPGAQGHPPRSTRITNTVENIGSGITSLVNQQRLAAAAVNLPSQVTLPQRTTRRRRRGQAISPPTLAPSFSINSVLSNDSSSPLFRIKVKVYPPQVSISH